MRLPDSAHTEQPWRIHELAPDFRLEDVWQIPGTGGPDDFTHLVEGVATTDPSQGAPAAVRTLFAIRRRLGEVLGWDDHDAGLGSRVPTLRDRLPADLRGAPGPEGGGALPFTPLYMTEDEWAVEIANKTTHAVIHLGRVADRSGGFRAQMAILVKPNGLLGDAYLAAIRPFRHLIIYPALMRRIGREWPAAGRQAADRPQ